MSDILGGKEISPKPPVNLFDYLEREPGSSATEFFKGLSGMVMNWMPSGFPEMRGASPYPGRLSPDINNTMLPNVYNNWQPWNQGLGYMSNYLGSPNAGKMSPAFQTAMSNMMQYGGVGGYPTQLMSGMAQFGGTGGLGNKAMSYATQFGVPSAAGQNLANMAQYGVAGQWGGPLLNRATGGPTAALNYLSPFLTARPYRSRG